ncbi:hypothetical protein Tsubulata_011632 [Turnera subulata]|uniref:Polymerase nucleotidyl transferase domain-containing protein n=1 Tax=Turnera subulata TaxID=218843 RepID=A0A9Q0IZS0_9ROSI|nr:hypothetical protein Tsubulata_011632 [Turnera subulata]
MGDLRAWSPEPNGAALEERLSSSSSNDQTAIGVEHWQKAEDATQGIIARVQPTLVSEERRKAVIDYVQRLIRTSIGCEVYPFGSVPLKTYLPDGDIDLTAFGGMNAEEALANDVCAILESEERNCAAEFVVKDVQLIRAEVKLVKCLVQNIVVDISFNQLGGLCTLCFLEQVDRLICKDHLFKRSIILIKAWCYYESRILGAHHGLISTYALETLVLYIFHLFHSSLDGPLAVLYKFLDYFSKFDWDNYCISLNGPVRISSLPEVVVERPENCGSDLLLSSEFLKDCVEMFSVPPRGFESNSRTFPPKHLNIVDPLKENNNLGRSVSKGNFYRIRSAFTYGARKLARILSLQEEIVAGELSKFFANTLERHGSGQRPDVQDPTPLDVQYGFALKASLSGRESYQDFQTICGSEFASAGSIVSGKCGLDNEHFLLGGVSGPEMVGREMTLSGAINGAENCASGIHVTENRISGDAKDLASSSTGVLIPNDAVRASAPSVEESVSKAHHAPHLYFSSSVMRNGEMMNGAQGKQQQSSDFTAKGISPRVQASTGEETTHVACGNSSDDHLQYKHEVLSSFASPRLPVPFSSVTCSSEDLNRGHLGNRASPSAAGSSGLFNCLSDLSGDYECQRNSLLNGRWLYEHSLNGPVPPMSPPPMSPPLPPQFRGKNSWDAIRQSLQLRHNVMSMNANGVVPRSVFYPMGGSPLGPGAAFGMDEMQKPRGTGTYFPNMNHYRDRPLNARGRNQTTIRSPRNNGRMGTFHDPHFPERNSSEMSHARFHSHHGVGESGASDLRHSGSPETRPSNVNGSLGLSPSEKGLEFGSIGDLQLEASATESSKPPSPSLSPSQKSIASEIPEMQRPKPVLGIVPDRISAQSYRLKDEDDFPPLSDSSSRGLSICVPKP